MFLLEGDKDLEEYGDKLVVGECWTWKELENVEYWNIILALAFKHLCFNNKYQKILVTLLVSLHETMTTFSTSPNDKKVVS